TCATFRSLHTFVSLLTQQIAPDIRGHLRSAAVVVFILALPPVVANGQQAQPASSRYKAPVLSGSDTSRLKGPRQPIFFRHDIHAGQDQIPCRYSHYSASISCEPPIPPLKTCIRCHHLIGGATPSHQAEIKQ